MNDTQTSTTALTDTPTTTKRTRSHFARRQEPQDVDVRNFLDCSDSGNSADPRDSTDDDYTQDQENNTTTGTPTTTKRTRSHFARRQEPQDVDVPNFLDGSDSGSADPRDSTDYFLIVLFHSMLIGYIWRMCNDIKKDLSLLLQLFYRLHFFFCSLFMTFFLMDF